LAMADCLGRFGRASHSNPRYHSPTQNFGQVQMHVQRNSCDSCGHIGLCFICTPDAICHLPSCKTNCHLQSRRAYAPFTVSPLVEHYKTCPIRPREFASLSQELPLMQPIRPAMLATLGAGSTPAFALKAWHRLHLAMSATRLARPRPPSMC
jgi:hypothetical protein